jgi:hypothetical protein
MPGVGSVRLCPYSSFMRVRVDDTEHAADLLKHLLRAECNVVRTGERILAVALREPLSYELARGVVDAHLAEWRKLRTGAHAVLID